MSDSGFALLAYVPDRSEWLCLASAVERTLLDGLAGLLREIRWWPARVVPCVLLGGGMIQPAPGSLDPPTEADCMPDFSDFDAIE
ncbi:MAG: hypothetical protein [Microviridae sp.]|nr:MAG: hypothetical protein [Microviridae sp.]